MKTVIIGICLLFSLNVLAQSRPSGSDVVISPHGGTGTVGGSTTGPTVTPNTLTRPDRVQAVGGQANQVRCCAKCAGNNTILNPSLVNPESNCKQNPSANWQLIWVPINKCQNGKSFINYLNCH